MVNVHVQLIPTNPPPTLAEPAKWSENFRNFIAACLVKDPNERPSAIDLLAVREPASPAATSCICCSASFSYAPAPRCIQHMFVRRVKGPEVFKPLVQVYKTCRKEQRLVRLIKPPLAIVCVLTLSLLCRRSQEEEREKKRKAKRLAERQKAALKAEAEAAKEAASSDDRFATSCFIENVDDDSGGRAASSSSSSRPEFSTSVVHDGDSEDGAGDFSTSRFIGDDAEDGAGDFSTTRFKPDDNDDEGGDFSTMRIRPGDNNDDGDAGDFSTMRIRPDDNNDEGDAGDFSTMRIRPDDNDEGDAGDFSTMRIKPDDNDEGDAGDFSTMRIKPAESTQPAASAPVRTHAATEASAKQPTSSTQVTRPGPSATVSARWRSPLHHPSGGDTSTLSAGMPATPYGRSASPRNAVRLPKMPAIELVRTGGSSATPLSQEALRRQQRLRELRVSIAVLRCELHEIRRVLTECKAQWARDHETLALQVQRLRESTAAANDQRLPRT